MISDPGAPLHTPLRGHPWSTLWTKINYNVERRVWIRAQDRIQGETGNISVPLSPLQLAKYIEEQLREDLKE